MIDVAPLRMRLDLRHPLKAPQWPAGIGLAPINPAREMKTRGHSFLGLKVKADNASAIRLCQILGFVVRSPR